MKITTKLILISSLAALGCFAQSDDKKPEEPVKYYRLDFTVKELEAGKVVGSRSYFTSLSSQRGDTSSVRTGDKVPVMQANNQFTYLDVGTNIDSNSLRPVENGVALHVGADISTNGATDPASSLPLVRQTKWTSTVLVPLRKATTIFSSDGASTKRQMQLELTVTPIP